MGFSDAPTKPRSDIYITIDEAFLPRQTLLSRAIGSAGGVIPLSQNVSGLNLQVALEVRGLNGERLDGCIFTSSNSEPQSTWESTIVSRGDSWKQSLRLAIPESEVSTSHLFITLIDVPNDAFAVCYLPLWDEEAFIRNGHHSLLLYGYDENKIITKRSEEKVGYLYHPWNSRSKNEFSKDENGTGLIATLGIQTCLCSTEFLQNKTLIDLLKWRELQPTQVQELLKQLVFVPEIEVVKLLKDVFNAIFAIMVEQTDNNEYEDLIFSALITVLGIVHDRRFNIGPLVDQYAENEFYYPLATSYLVRSLTRLLAKPSDPETSRKLRATFKVVKYILKFITRARGQEKDKETAIGITTTSFYTRNLRGIFKALDNMMRSEAPILIGSKTLAVQHFHLWLPELNGLLEKEEIVHIAIDFIDSCSAVKGKLILYKLILIINYSKLDIFFEKEQRKALCMNTVRWIEPLWEKIDEDDVQWRDQLRLCCSVVASQVEDLVNEIPDYIPKIINSFSHILDANTSSSSSKENMKFSLLFPTTYPFPSKSLSTPKNFDEALVELSAILSAISMRPAGIQLELAGDEMAKTLHDTLNLHLNILNCEAFPASWLSVHIYHHRSAMKTLEYIGGILLDSFIPEPDDAEYYNTELWKVFFTVLLKLISSDILALETFPEQKRRAVWKIAGDIRETGAELMRMTWEANGWGTTVEEKCRYGLSKMGGYQVQYVPYLIGPIIELCLSVHEGLRKVAVDILRTIIVSEWSLSEDISIVQTEIIECLDRIFRSKRLTESILQKLFITELESLFDPLSRIQGDPLYTATHELISKTSEFLDLLVAVYSTDAVGEAAHLINHLRLMEFLRDMQKEEILIGYIHQLAQLQSDAGDFAEAGHSLRLHAELYEWDPTQIVPALVSPEFPAQSHFERKERIYFDMIRFLEDGEAWSSALSAYQELQLQYQENVYDFSKLARTQRAIGSIYEKLAKSDKLIPKYFRVAYKGLGFPPSLRDQEFVYEGHLNEKQASFLDRMQAAYPAAQINDNHDLEIFEGQYLQITSLSPYRDLEHPVLQRTRVPISIRDYILSSFPQSFSLTLKRNTTGPVSSHTAEKVVYTTIDRFPNILRRSRIETVNRKVMGALETGLERVIRKMAEMTIVEKRVARGESKMAPLLIEALKTSVDSYSESAISQYRSLLPENLLDKDKKTPVSDSSPLENALKTALIDFAIMIRRCLIMFSEPENQFLMSDGERKSLIQAFESTFAPELASYAFPQQSSIFAPLNTGLKTSSWSLNPPVLSYESGQPFSPFDRNTPESPTTHTSKKRLSFFKKRHERREDLDPNPGSRFISVASTATVLSPVVNANGLHSNGSEKSKNNIYGNHSFSTNNSKRNSLIRLPSNEQYLTEINETGVVFKQKSLIFSSNRSRASASREETRQRDNESVKSNSHDLSRRSSSKYPQMLDNNGDISHCSSPHNSTRVGSGFGKVAVGVKKRLSIVGLGIVGAGGAGRRKIGGGERLIENSVMEEA